MRRCFWLFAVCWLTAASAWAQDDTVVERRWVSAGYELTSAADADFWVTATWIVPRAIQGSKTCGFKRSWVQEDVYASGSVGNVVRPGMMTTGECGDGPGGGSTSSVMFSTDDKGPKVNLSLSWHLKKRSGEISNTYALPWSELKKTFHEKDAKIYLSVVWPKKRSLALPGRDGSPSRP